MNTFALEIWYDEGHICTFYTVMWLESDDETTSETDIFFDKYAASGNPYEDKALQLFRLITDVLEIGMEQRMIFLIVLNEWRMHYLQNQSFGSKK